MAAYAQTKMWQAIRTAAERKLHNFVLGQLPGDNPPLLCTVFPPWADPTATAFGANIDALNPDPTDAAVKYFQNAIRARFEVAASGEESDDESSVKDILIAYQKDFQPTDSKAAKLARIRGLMSKKWTEISPTVQTVRAWRLDMGVNVLIDEKDPDPQPDATLKVVIWPSYTLRTVRWTNTTESLAPPAPVPVPDETDEMNFDQSRVVFSSSAVTLPSEDSSLRMNNSAAASTASGQGNAMVVEPSTTAQPSTVDLDDPFWDIEADDEDEYDDSDDFKDDGFSDTAILDTEEVEAEHQSNPATLEEVAKSAPHMKSELKEVVPRFPVTSPTPLAQPHASEDTNPLAAPLVLPQRLPPPRAPPRPLTAANLSSRGSDPSASADDGSTQSFYLFSSDFALYSPAANIGFLTKDDPFEKFVLGLPKAYMAVNRDPSSPTGVEQHLTIRDNDAWAQYVLGNGLNLKNLQLFLTVSSGTRQVASVTAVTVDLVLATTTPTTLSFSTDDAATMFGLSTQPGLPHQPIIFLDNYGLLPLGLSNNVSGLSLSSILTLLAPPWLTDPTQPATLVLDALADSLMFGLSKSPNARNGIYFRTDDTSTTYLRLEFDLSSTVDALISWLKAKNLMPVSSISASGLTFTCILVGRSELLANNLRSSTKTTFCFSGAINFKHGNINFWLNFQKGCAQLVLQFPNVNPADIAEDVFTWLRTTLDLGDAASQQSNLSSDQVKSLIPSNDISVTVHQAEIFLGQTGFTCTVTLEVVIFGTFFFTTFKFPQFDVRADLWCSTPITSDPTMRYVPWYEPYQELVPFDVLQSGVPSSVDFTGIVQHSSTTPATVPPPPDTSFLSFQEAYIEVQTGIDSAINVDLFATIALQAPPTDIPLVWPKYFTVHASGEKMGQSPNSSTDWDLSLRSSFYLPQRANAPNSANSVSLDVVITKTTDKWTVSGKAEGLDFGALYAYFDTDAKESVMDILEGIGVTYIDVEYSHGPGEDRNLLVQGAFELKTIVLQFDYHWTKSAAPTAGAATKTSWTFDASLAPITSSGDEVTLIEVIGEFVPDGDNSSILQTLGEIPFIKDLKIATAAASEADSPVIFGMAKSSTSGAVSMFLQIQIITDAGVISTLFIQRKAPPKPNSGPGNNSGSGSKTDGVKRYIRVRLDKLPTLQNVPIVGSLIPPLDSIDYVYVQDLSTPGSDGGLSADDIADMNEVRKQSNISHLGMMTDIVK
jgi:hypothetical protein